jgi:hypothetical protein
MARPAGDARIGQGGVARAEFQHFDIQAEAVGSDPRERRPGPLAHVVRAGLHHAGAVTPQHGVGLGLEHVRAQSGSIERLHDARTRQRTGGRSPIRPR